MKITVIISAMLIAQVSAAFYDVFQGAIHSVQSSFGKLFSDVVTDVKDTVDCTILAVEHVLSLSQDATARYYEKCGRAPNGTVTEKPVVKLPAVEISISNNEEYLKKIIPEEIDARINATLAKFLNGHNSHDRLEDVEKGLTKQTERLANVSELVKQELEKLSNEIHVDFKNVDRKNSKPSIDAVLEQLKLLESVEHNIKDTHEAEEVHHLIDDVLHKLNAIEASSTSENAKVEGILKELENNSNSSYTDLRNQIKSLKEAKAMHIELIKNKLQEHDRKPERLEFLQNSNFSNAEGVLPNANVNTINNSSIIEINFDKSAMSSSTLRPSIETSTAKPTSVSVQNNSQSATSLLTAMTSTVLPTAKSPSESLSSTTESINTKKSASMTTKSPGTDQVPSKTESLNTNQSPSLVKELISTKQSPLPTTESPRTKQFSSSPVESSSTEQLPSSTTVSTSTKQLSTSTIKPASTKQLLSSTTESRSTKPTAFSTTETHITTPSTTKVPINNIAPSATTKIEKRPDTNTTRLENIQSSTRPVQINGTLQSTTPVAITTSTHLNEPIKSTTMSTALTPKSNTTYKESTSEMDLKNTLKTTSPKVTTKTTVEDKEASTPIPRLTTPKVSTQVRSNVDHLIDDDTHDNDIVKSTAPAATTETTRMDEDRNTNVGIDYTTTDSMHFSTHRPTVSTPNLNDFLNYVDRVVSTSTTSSTTEASTRAVHKLPITIPPVLPYSPPPSYLRSNALISPTKIGLLPSPRFLPPLRIPPLDASNMPTLPLFNMPTPPKPVDNDDSIFPNNVRFPPPPRLKLPQKDFSFNLPSIQPKIKLNSPFDFFKHSPMDKNESPINNSNTDFFNDPDVKSLLLKHQKAMEEHERALKAARELIAESKRAHRIMDSIFNKNKGRSAFSTPKSLKFDK